MLQSNACYVTHCSSQSTPGQTHRCLYQLLKSATQCVDHTMQSRLHAPCLCASAGAIQLIPCSQCNMISQKDWWYAELATVYVAFRFGQNNDGIACQIVRGNSRSFVHAQAVAEAPAQHAPYTATGSAHLAHQALALALLTMQQQGGKHARIVCCHQAMAMQARRIPAFGKLLAPLASLTVLPMPHRLEHKLCLLITTHKLSCLQQVSSTSDGMQQASVAKAESQIVPCRFQSA